MNNDDCVLIERFAGRVVGDTRTHAVYFLEESFEPLTLCGLSDAQGIEVDGRQVRFDPTDVSACANCVYQATRVRVDPIEAERDELWSAMQRVALNLCDCDARDGHECPVYPAEHREHCEYALSHRKRGEDDNALIEWDDPNLSLA